MSDSSNQQTAAKAASAMWSAWVDAQEQAMRGWADMASKSSQAWTQPSAPANATGADDGQGIPGLDDFISTWQRLSDQAMSAFSAAGNPGMLNVVEQMRAAQEMGFRLFGQTAEAWQRMSQQVDQGASWQEATATFGRSLEQAMQSFVHGPAAWGRTGAGAAELFRQYSKTIEQSLGPWFGAIQRDPVHAASAAPPPSSQLFDLGRMYWSALDRISDGMAASPRIGFGRETEERMIAGFDTWVDSMQAQYEYQVVLSECWAVAFQSAITALMARAEAGRPVTSLRELSHVWATETDKVMEAELAGERYAAAQGEMVNAMMRNRKAEREIADAALAGSYLASKSELDEAYRAISELRRTVRQLSRKIEDLSGGQA